LPFALISARVQAFASCELFQDSLSYFLEMRALLARDPTRRSTTRSFRWWARQDSNLQPDRYERQTIDQVR
jgi:hypothetical protein